jgi:hypothetical protein
MFVMLKKKKDITGMPTDNTIPDGPKPSPSPEPPGPDPPSDGGCGDDEDVSSASTVSPFIKSKTVNCIGIFAFWLYYCYS